MSTTTTTKPRSLPRKIGRGIWLVLAWVWMIGYIAGTAPRTLDWFKMQYYDSVSMAEVSDRIMRGVEAGYVTASLQVMKSLSREKDAEIVAHFSPLTPKLPPLFMFEFARRSWQRDIEEAAYWAALGKFRMSYDAARCGETITVRFSTLMANKLVPEPVNIHLGRDIENTKTALRRVLVWDDEHTSENDPRYVCEIAKRMGVVESTMLKSVTDWPLLHRVLRQSVVDFIEGDIPEDMQ